MPKWWVIGKLYRIQIVYHIDVHSTDEDKLLRSISKSAKPLDGVGVIVPGPNVYRPILRGVVEDIAQGHGTAQTRQEVTSKIIGNRSARRLVMSNQNFCCVTNRILKVATFTFWMTQNLQRLTISFPTMK